MSSAASTAAKGPVWERSRTSVKGAPSGEQIEHTGDRPGTLTGRPTETTSVFMELQRRFARLAIVVELSVDAL
jgi:hypothetical protein